jgi:hypothetical protein
MGLASVKSGVPRASKNSSAVANRPCGEERSTATLRRSGSTCAVMP